MLLICYNIWPNQKFIECLNFSSCHRNESMYAVLNLEAVVNVSQVSQYQVKYGITEEMRELQKQIKLSNDVTILTEDAKVRLLELASSSLSDIDFTAYNDVVENQITSIDLKKLAAVINETTKKLKPERDAVYFSLINDVMYIESFQTNVVDKMVDLSKRLRVSTNALQEDLKFNHTSLRQAIHQLLREVDDAQDYLQNKGPEEVVKVLNYL
jgi:prominin 1